MADTRVSFQCRIALEARDAVGRLAKLTGYSQAQLTERLFLNLEGAWLECFAAEERARYFAGKIKFPEARAIRARAKTSRVIQLLPVQLMPHADCDAA
jgi:hypothetical protein